MYLCQGLRCRILRATMVQNETLSLKAPGPFLLNERLSSYFQRQQQLHPVSRRTTLGVVFLWSRFSVVLSLSKGPLLQFALCRANQPLLVLRVRRNGRKRHLISINLPDLPEQGVAEGVRMPTVSAILDTMPLALSPHSSQRWSPP